MSITISALKKSGIMVDNKFAGFEGLSLTDTASIIRDLIYITNNYEFKTSPSLYLSAMKAERGPTTEMRVPRDISHFIIMKNLAYFTKN